ncbi:MAG: hypothetical protein D3906_18325 [Candidatus Electrothrix sp. AUS1_2]|nr:hypothetical protein [Candidatus Electrothrix sp. AUS1_2]
MRTGMDEIKGKTVFRLAVPFFICGEEGKLRRCIGIFFCKFRMKFRQLITGPLKDGQSGGIVLFLLLFRRDLLLPAIFFFFLRTA